MKLTRTFVVEGSRHSIASYRQRSQYPRVFGVGTRHESLPAWAPEEGLAFGPAELDITYTETEEE